MSERNKDVLFGRLTEMLGLKPSQAPMVKVLVIVLVVGIFILYAGNQVGVVDRPPSTGGAREVVSPPAGSKDELAQLEEAMARDLEQTLSLIRGAGKVSAKVRLLSGPAVQPVTDTRVDSTVNEEKLTDGSTRTTTTRNTATTTVMTKQAQEDSLAVVKRTNAEVEGVLIVATGARNAFVRSQIHQAAVTALGVPAHRVEVMPAEGR